MIVYGDHDRAGRSRALPEGAVLVRFPSDFHAQGFVDFVNAEAASAGQRAAWVKPRTTSTVVLVPPPGTDPALVERVVRRHGGVVSDRPVAWRGHLHPERGGLRPRPYGGDRAGSSERMDDPWGYHSDVQYALERMGAHRDDVIELTNRPAVAQVIDTKRLEGTSSERTARAIWERATARDGVWSHLRDQNRKRGNRTGSRRSPEIGDVVMVARGRYRGSSGRVTRVDGGPRGRGVFVELDGPVGSMTGEVEFFDPSRDLKLGFDPTLHRAAPPATGGVAEFVEELRSLLDVGDRQVRIRWDQGEHPLGGPSRRYDSVDVNYINLPAGVGSAGGGAEAENNRTLFFVEGFHGADPHAPPPRGKVKVEQRMTLPAARGLRLRARTGTPSQVARYLADYLNRLAREVPPMYTHTEPRS